MNQCMHILSQQERAASCVLAIRNRCGRFLRLRGGLVVAMAISMFASSVFADPINAVRGLANHVDVEYGPRLRSRTDQSPTSTVLVRVSPVASGVSGTSTRQRIEFIGTVVGTFDLRNFIEREDGRAITELAAIPVVVGSQLPADAGTDLYSSGSSWFNWAAHYRTLLWAAVALWAAVPVVYFVVRAMRKPAAAATVAPPPPPPTVEEQLIAAIRSASTGPLTTDERGRLEMLVFRYFGGWPDHPDVSEGDIAETFRKVREHPETREVVIALERWLHAKDGERGREAAAAALEELRRSRLARPHGGTTAAPVAMEATA